MRFFSLIILTFLLIGCTSTTPSIHEYTLLLPQNTHTNEASLSTKTLSIASAKSLGSLSGKNVLYLRESTETGAYLYSKWSDTPSILIQRSLIQSLQNKNLFAMVAPTSSLAQSDWILESELDGFYHRFTKISSEGYIDITYRLIDPKTKHVVASKRFVITSPAPSMDAQGGVEALKNSLHELNTQCTAWLNTYLKENL